jgi:tetratricopeptide (TPR) repeat protein
MDAVTYPNKAVIEFINSNMIAVRVRHDQRPLAEDFKVKWTPVLITLDVDGTERNRTVGFLPPEELIPSLMSGIGKAHLERGEFAKAIPQFEKLVSKYPKSGAAPEAVFFLGVARYQSTHDPKFLKKAYEQLAAQYPQSQWTTRASPYSTIK